MREACLSSACEARLQSPHMLRLPAMSQPWEASVTGSDQTRMAKCADEWGYDMIAVPEHFVIPREHVELSGPHYLQSTVAQAYLAGATERIALNSCITVLPLQHPIVLAKALATADWMSSGRMMVTFGVGWLQGSSTCSASHSMSVAASPTSTWRRSSNCGRAISRVSRASTSRSTTSRSSPSQFRSHTCPSG